MARKRNAGFAEGVHATWSEEGVQLRSLYAPDSMWQFSPATEMIARALASSPSLADARRALGKSASERELSEQESVWRQELERISGLTADEAKRQLIGSLENDARHDAQRVGRRHDLRRRPGIS